MPKKTTTKNKVTAANRADVVERRKQSRSGIFDYLQFGESYTSLILGIVAVIIATVMLLSFVHSKNVSTTKQATTEIASQNNKQNSQKIAQVSQPPTDTPMVITPTVIPTATVAVKVSPSPKVVKKVTPTMAKKKIFVAKPTPVKKAKSQSMKQVMNGHGKYVVVAGDSLWTIAEKTYKSGYNWVDIARANKLNNPDDIHKGNVLVLPKVSPKMTTVQEAVQNNTSMVHTPQEERITGTTYTVAKGDSLWSIAVRAYGDGYKWVNIAKANNLANPGTIYSGNVLRIPRR